MAKYRKQVSLDFIEYTKRTINELLASKIPQSCKQSLCIMMEKLLRDTKSDGGFYYLYWNKFGKLDWDVEKYEILQDTPIGGDIVIPKCFITGPEYDGTIEFVSDIQGEYSRHYR